MTRAGSYTSHVICVIICDMYDPSLQMWLDSPVVLAWSVMTSRLEREDASGVCTRISIIAGEGQAWEAKGKGWGRMEHKTLHKIGVFACQFGIGLSFDPYPVLLDFLDRF